MEAAMASETGQQAPSGTCLVYFDNDCGLCTHAMRWLCARCAVTPVPLADGAAASALIVLIDGRPQTGAVAVRTLLRRCHGRTWRALGWALGVPPVSQLTDLAYRAVAANRTRISSVLGWSACEVRRPSAFPEHRVSG